MVSLVGQSIASATHLAGKTEGNTVFISKDQNTKKKSFKQHYWNHLTKEDQAQ